MSWSNGGGHASTSSSHSGSSHSDGSSLDSSARTTPVDDLDDTFQATNGADSLGHISLTSSKRKIDAVEVNVLPRARVMALEYAPFATLNHALRQFRSLNGAPYLQRSLVHRRFRRREDERSSYPPPRKRTCSAFQSKQSQSTLSLRPYALRRPKVFKQPRWPPLSYVEITLESVKLRRQMSRSGNGSVVRRYVPIEVFIYYSNTARGCLDDS